MGKPSSRSSRRSSSVKSNLSIILHNIKMPPKNSKEWRKRNNKNEERTRKSITGLFNKLRGSSSTINNNSSTSVIVLDDSIECPNSKKRKLSTLCNETLKRKRLSNESIVEIKDDDLVINNNLCTSIRTPKKTLSPIHSSTPNNKLFHSNKEATATKSLHEDIVNLTKEINRDSYLTIDLTNNSDNTKTENITVVDLERTTDNTLLSVSNHDSTISDDSEVTVLESSAFIKKNMQKFASDIGKLNSSEKGRLLELLADNIINGCSVNNNLMKKLKQQGKMNQSTETVEDAYIKEFIVGGASSHNSIGSNIYNPERDAKNKVGLRMVVIDGSNVAMEHHKGRGFSVKGLKICIDYFLKRGHVVKAFVPRFRCKFGKSSDPRLLDEMERRGYVVYTPSREVQGKTITPYDDRYIVQCAAEFDAVIVSGDNYRDLMHENPRWKFVIENRLLQFTWVNDMIMFPKDPLGRNGPTLEEFLRHPTHKAPSKVDIKRVLEAVQSGSVRAENIIPHLAEVLYSSKENEDKQPDSSQLNDVNTLKSSNIKTSKALNTKKSRRYASLKQKILQRKQRRKFRKLNLKYDAGGVSLPNPESCSNSSEVINLDPEPSTPDFISIHVNKPQDTGIPVPIQSQEHSTSNFIPIHVNKPQDMGIPVPIQSQEPSTSDFIPIHVNIPKRRDFPCHRLKKFK